jgi:hypothetical protein
MIYYNKGYKAKPALLPFAGQRSKNKFPRVLSPWSHTTWASCPWHEVMTKCGKCYLLGNLVTDLVPQVYVGDCSCIPSAWNLLQIQDSQMESINNFVYFAGTLTTPIH